MYWVGILYSYEDLHAHFHSTQRYSPLQSDCNAYLVQAHTGVLVQAQAHTGARARTGVLVPVHTGVLVPVHTGVLVQARTEAQAQVQAHTAVRA